jgi:ABC-type Fe3+ transport system, periplasmic component
MVKLSSGLRAAAVLAVTAALAAGCLASETSETVEAESGFDAILNAAKEEGTVTWYSSLPQATTDRLVAAFTEKYGIEVNAVVLASSLLTARISSEHAAGSYEVDVLNAADPVFMKDMMGEGWFATVNADDLPSLQTWPADYFFEDAYALVNIQPQGISFNTDKVSAEEVDTWEELLDPKFKGEIFYSDPRVTKSWLVMADLLYEELGPEFLSALAEQDLQVVDSPVSASQNLAAGSGMVLFSNLRGVVDPLVEKGAPIGLVFPNPTTGVEQFTAVMQRAPHPNAARLLMDFLLSEDGQKIMNEKTGSSPRGALEGTLPLPEGYVRADFERANERQDELFSLLGLS